MRSTFGFVSRLTLAGLPVAGALIGCGGSGNGPHAGVASLSADDGGKARDASPNVVDASSMSSDDASSVSADAMAFGDGGVSCIEGGAGPKGTQLASSSTVSILGLTDDDQVVYTDSSSNTAFAVPAASGTAVSIGHSEGSTTISSKAVFNWTGLSADGTVATGLEVWTAAGGVKSLSGNFLTGEADCSADASRILYFDDASGTTADLFVAEIDGSNKTLLAPGIFWNSSCLPQFFFLGSDAVLANCTAAPTGLGSPAGTLAVFVGAAGAAKTLSTSALMSFQSSGSNVLFNDARGLVVGSAMTGATAVIDPAGGTSSVFTHDGTSVVYLATDGSIRRSPIASPSPTTLVSGGFSGLSAISPNDQWVLASTVHDSNTGNTDIDIASATTAGASVTILGSPTGTFYGSPFTADSNHVLYVDGTMNGAGNYHVAPTTGGAGLQIAIQTWIGFATRGAKVVYQDDFVPGVGPNGQGIADIKSVDVSAASPTPSLLVTQADPNLYFTSSGSAIVYSMTFCAAGSQGIWVMPTP